MDGEPILALCFGFPMVGIGLFLFAFSFLLKKPAAGGEYRRTMLVVSLVILSTGIAAFAAQWYIWSVESDRARHWDLSYDVTLEMNGTGSVRVALPLPTAEALYADLQVSPSSSTHSIDRSSGYPLLVIEMSENTTIHGSLYSLKSDIETELTRTSPADSECWRWQNPCTSSVTIHVLGGSVQGVRVDLRAQWHSPCHGHIWEPDCDAIPGDHEYPGEWGEYIC